MYAHVRGWPIGNARRATGTPQPSGISCADRWWGRCIRSCAGIWAVYAGGANATGTPRASTGGHVGYRKEGNR